MHLKTCGKEDCRPVQQTRGRMGPGDYVDVIKAHEHAVPNPAVSAVDMNSSRDLHLLVEQSDDGKDDIRICCMTCGKVTPWQHQDAPGMPGVGIIFTRNLWNSRHDTPTGVDAELSQLRA